MVGGVSNFLQIQYYQHSSASELVFVEATLWVFIALNEPEVHGYLTPFRSSGNNYRSVFRPDEFTI